MKHNRHRKAVRIAALLCLGAIAAVVPAAASTTLLPNPLHQSLDAGGTGSVSILLPDSLDIRLAELWVEYDPAVVEYLHLDAGALFTDPGMDLFTDFRVESPGLWHAYVVTQDPGQHASGPGELLSWSFLAIGEGVSPITGVSVNLYDASGDPIPDVDLEAGSILVSTNDRVELWIAPESQLIAVDDTAGVSIMLTDTLDVRSIELWIDYDPTIIEHLEGGPGALFLDQPCYLFEDFELLAPGSLHAYVVIIGHECFISTPGELMTWSFTGVAEGTSPITSIDVDLYDKDGLPIDDVHLRSAEVRVVPQGSVVLYTAPEDQTVDIGEIGALTVELQVEMDIRSVELWVHFDPTIVTHRTGGAGALFQNLPCITWTDFELVEPGLWHAFAVIIGHDCWTTGPGEVMIWEFEGLAEGVCPVVSVTADLYAVDGLPLPNVHQTPATIRVVRPYGDAGTPPAAPGRVGLHPNPFNPAVALDLPPTGGRSATLSIHDARGRRVRRLWDGIVGPAGLRLDWNGRDDTGRAMPSGNYLFILDVAGERRISTRGTLLR